MSALVKRHPALSLFFLSSILGVGPLALVAVGLVPIEFAQLGALSASIAGFILAAVEGGRRSLVELLRRALIWRVGIGWWSVSLLYTALIALAALGIAEWLNAANVDRQSVHPHLASRADDVRSDHPGGPGRRIRLAGFSPSPIAAAVHRVGFEPDRRSISQPLAPSTLHGGGNGPVWLGSRGGADPGRFRL